MLAEKEAIAMQMTGTAAVASWTVYAGGLVLGYLLYGHIPGETRDFGRFRDLNFGRVIAFLMFAVFWFQGLAIVHWLKGEGFLPVFALVAVYALLLVLNVLFVMALAVLGYIDTWFHVRRVRRAQ